MRLPRVPLTIDPPPWPPLLATRGPAGRSARHAHHAMHLVLCLGGELRVRTGAAGPWRRAAGVLTAADVPHAIDGGGAEALLVFIDPESEVGRALQTTLPGAVRLVTAAERADLGDASPDDIMRAGGVDWTHRAVAALGAAAPMPPRQVHPRVRKLLALLRHLPSGADDSLDALAAAVGLSPGRLMHAFTESIGLPLRPYLAWLRLQRAAAAVVSGRSLTEAAYSAGFADPAHMSRTFRRMLGMPPSALRPKTVAS